MYYSAWFARFISVDSHASKYLGWSPYVYVKSNPIRYIDPDGNDVLPTNDLKSKKEIYNIFKLAEKNSGFRNVLKSFYKNQSNVWIHTKQLKKNGKPTGIGNSGNTEPPRYTPTNQIRININSDLLTNSGELVVDKTFLFKTFIHEAIHARLDNRILNAKTKENLEKSYPGHADFLFRESLKEKQHEQMAAYNRPEIVSAMKEFDEQLRELGENVPDTHTEDWYQAMAWSGLQRTIAWKNFKKENKEKAKLYDSLIRKEFQNAMVIKNSERLPEAIITGKKEEK